MHRVNSHRFTYRSKFSLKLNNKSRKCATNFFAEKKKCDRNPYHQPREKLIRRRFHFSVVTTPDPSRSFLFSSLAVSRFDGAISDGFMEKLDRRRAGLVPGNWGGKRIYILARFICGAVNPLTADSARKRRAKSRARVIY